MSPLYYAHTTTLVHTPSLSTTHSLSVLHTPYLAGTNTLAQYDTHPTKLVQTPFVPPQYYASHTTRLVAIAQHAVSVPHKAQEARRLIAPYGMSVPDTA
eukprot:3043501-Rhodomonas_salina.1